MIVVNLFGAPGSGKSTGAAYIYSKLKMAGFNVELVTEFAKDLTWEGNQNTLSNQLYVSGCQSYRLSRLKDKVDAIITDSPLPLGCIYTTSNTPPSLQNTLFEEYNKYENINFLIIRDKPYNPKGRNQTEEESNEIQQVIQNLLENHNVEYTKIKGNKDGYDYIIKIIGGVIH